jgi:hypothetical protein
MRELSGKVGCIRMVPRLLEVGNRFEKCGAASRELLIRVCRSRRAID